MTPNFRTGLAIFRADSRIPKVSFVLYRILLAQTPSFFFDHPRIFDISAPLNTETMERISNESTSSQKDFLAHMLDDLMYFLNGEKFLEVFYLNFFNLKI